MKNKKKIVLLLAVFYSVLLIASDNPSQAFRRLSQNDTPIDTTKINAFFIKYPNFAFYRSEVKQLYSRHSYYIWYDNKGVIEFAQMLYNRVVQISEEGLPIQIPYQEQLNSIFTHTTSKPESDSELLISSMYFFYTEKVFSGLAVGESRDTGWYLPRERISYAAYLDTVVKNKDFPKEFKPEFFNQYYNLKKALARYREMEKKGGWHTATFNKGIEALKEGDSSVTVMQVRSRLFAEGFLSSDNQSMVFEKTMLEGIHSYNRINNRDSTDIITPDLLKTLNIVIAERIKTISVNMERCRWISPKINNAQEYIAVNIPSFRMLYFRNGKPLIISKVVVGKEMHRTVVFSGEMSYIAFSPYWNVPHSILVKEILPAIKKDPDYLRKQNMEWANGKLRQKPGGNNALGHVKFMFPNSNNIYLHDSPAKSYFGKEKRAFSHGCIRVAKARELALAIMEKEANWQADRLDLALNGTNEIRYVLKEKIPVYIAYFTAWSDENGNVAFYEDVYARDERLSQVLFKN